MKETIIEGTSSNFFFRVAQWSLTLLALLLPIWFLPVTIAPVPLNKVFLVSALTLISFLFYLAHAIMQGRVTIFVHWLYALMLFLVGVWVVSAITSSQTFLSLLGDSGLETNTVFVLAIFCLLVFLIPNIFAHDVRAYQRFLGALGLGFLLLIIMTGFFLFGGGKLLGGQFNDSTFNTIGSWRSVGLALGFSIMLIYPFLLGSQGKFRWALAAI